MSFNLTAPPNPLTPLAWLPPDIAYQSQIGNYVVVGTLGAFLWDVLSNVNNDYKLVTEHRLGLGTAAYFFSRLSTLFYILMTTLFQTYELKNCTLSAKFNEASFAIVLPANCLLFFLRGRAIFNNNRYLVAFFFLLWLGVVGGGATIPTALTAGNVGPTEYCMNIAGKSYAAYAVTIAPLIHDTVIFLAISWRLFGNSHVNHGFTGNIRAFVTGEYLPQFSKAVLKDGQLYYVITVISNAIATILVFNTNLSVTYRTMFSVSNVMVTNAMACHVFRNTKFGTPPNPYFRTALT
ncbi:hypothetical protein B0H13DRAFT_1629112 [Mycena leptocephala]|nr:hypothetical protein B0H13DRAFT_1629112 [Mycena leptocephala]